MRHKDNGFRIYALPLAVIAIVTVGVLFLAGCASQNVPAESSSSATTSASSSSATASDSSSSSTSAAFTAESVTSTTATRKTTPTHIALTSSKGSADYRFGINDQGLISDCIYEYSSDSDSGSETIHYTYDDAGIQTGGYDEYSEGTQSYTTEQTVKQDGNNVVVTRTDTYDRAFQPNADITQTVAPEGLLAKFESVFTIDEHGHIIDAVVTQTSLSDESHPEVMHVTFDENGRIISRETTFYETKDGATVEHHSSGAFEYSDDARSLTMTITQDGQVQEPVTFELTYNEIGLLNNVSSETNNYQAQVQYIETPVTPMTEATMAFFVPWYLFY